MTVAEMAALVESVGVEKVVHDTIWLKNGRAIQPTATILSTGCDSCGWGSETKVEWEYL